MATEIELEIELRQCDICWSWNSSRWNL